MDNETASIVGLIGFFCYLWPLRHMVSKLRGDGNTSFIDLPHVIATGKARQGIVIRLGALLFLIGAFCAVLMTYQGLHLLISTPYYQDWRSGTIEGFQAEIIDRPRDNSSHRAFFAYYVLIPFIKVLTTVFSFCFPFLCIFLGVYSLRWGQKYIKDAVKVVMGK